MANSKSQFVLSSAEAISNAISVADGIKAQASALNDEKQSAIMDAYQHILTDLAQSGVKLVNRGKNKKGLPVKVMEALREQLSDAGVSASNVKRYAENAQKLLAKMPELLDCADYGSVALTLHNDGIVSQAKLVAKFTDQVDPVHKLAEKIVALDEAEYNRLLEVVRELKDAKAAEEAAKAQGDDVAETIDAVVDALDDVA